MKSRNIIILISIAILIDITACEEVIDIDLNYDDPAFEQAGAEDMLRGEE